MKKINKYFNIKDKIKKNDKLYCKYQKFLCIIKKSKRIADSIISYSFVIWIVLYGISRCINDNRSDNDLIKQQIEKNIGKGKITSIMQEDIHGFGNNSIIVTVGNKESLSQDIQNKIIIMDTVQNEILHNINDPFGLQSPYKVTFSYVLNNKIRNERVDLHPQIDSIIDIIGESDLTKEIIVKYGFFGVKKGYNINYIAIFRYSYEKTRYEIIGTYPVCEKLNLKTYPDENNKEEYTMTVQTVHTDFNKQDKSENSLLCYDADRQFNLTELSSYSYRDFWVDTQHYGRILVLAKVDMEKKTALVNCYYPLYEEDELAWNAIYSEYIPITSNECNDQILNALNQDMKGTIQLIE